MDAGQEQSEALEAVEEDSRVPKQGKQIFEAEEIGHLVIQVEIVEPAEFAIDHIPGAINLPALSDDERAEVGTLYKQVSPFLARKKGAALVLRNIATHMEGPLASQDGAWRRTSRSTPRMTTRPE